jgi:hypothetical protein
MILDPTIRQSISSALHALIDHGSRFPPAVAASGDA